MGDRLIIVDGYNVIHRSAALRPGAERTLRQAREKLVNLLSWAVGSGDARFGSSISVRVRTPAIRS